jgi:hypothetical protein
MMRGLELDGPYASLGWETHLHRIEKVHAMI